MSVKAAAGFKAPRTVFPIGIGEKRMNYYVYILRFDGTSTYHKRDTLESARYYASEAFLTDDASHVEITTIAPPVEGGQGVDWMR